MRVYYNFPCILNRWYLFLLPFFRTCLPYSPCLWHKKQSFFISTANSQIILPAFPSHSSHFFVHLFIFTSVASFLYANSKAFQQGHLFIVLSVPGLQLLYSSFLTIPSSYRFLLNQYYCRNDWTGSKEAIFETSNQLVDLQYFFPLHQFLSCYLHLFSTFALKVSKCFQSNPSNGYYRIQKFSSSQTMQRLYNYRLKGFGSRYDRIIWKQN